ncbi:zinc finger protein 106 isoform X2 [Austrofundulus limnaeus]|uniref:Zinc finger protein 106 isoform X2 n=1 Tax=Austrofundulus limnaeus TaxID=52670 RepID=A0A2I4BTT1_AUSLI|nr:PREDICTED: zinc finger protein 106-like isoform X2 [Austrofundulus limnaeus]
MAAVQSQEKVPKAAVKNKAPKNPKFKETFCIVCRRHYFTNEALEHMHCLQHHRMLRIVLGKDAVHNCQACKKKFFCLNEFASHLLMTPHIKNFENLRTKNVKPAPLSYSLSAKAITKILDRNRELKREQKKTKNKQTKKQKQEAAQRHSMQPNGTRTNTLVHQEATQGNFTQKQTRTSQQSQKAQSSVVVQNKENKISRVQQPHDYSGAPFHNAGWRPHYDSGPFGGHPPQYCQAQFAPPAHHPRFHSPFGNNQFSYRNAQNYRFNSPPPNALPAVSQYNYNTQYAGNAFTSDCLPDDGAILFDGNQSTNMESSQQEGSSRSAPPAPMSAPASAAPIREKDISAMLKQIRKELGVREPCRADREARKQSSEAGGGADGSGALQTAEQSADAAAPQAGTSAAPPGTAPGESKQTSQLFKSSAAEGRVKKEGEALVAKDASSSLKSPAFEPNLNPPRKVRIAHKAAQGEKFTPRKPVLDKLLNSSETRSQLNKKMAHSQRKRKNVKDKFKTGLVSLSTCNEPASPNAHPSLSEGFHWASVSDAPQAPPPPSDADTSWMLPRVQAPRSYQLVEKVCVKKEPNAEDETGRTRETDISTGKRKCRKTTGDGVSDGKKTKTTSNKDQSRMDQLLAVSLKEDELSRSLEDLDVSLIEARNALQAAYADVQRLLLLRQQFSAEINSLRAKRIEILQGLQGYCEASHSASSSLIQQPPAAAPSSSTAHPLPVPLTVAAALKQEVSRFASAEQAFPRAANSPQVPLIQLASSFPANVLFQPSHPPTPTASFAQQITAESCPPVLSPVPESSTGGQQQQEAGLGPKRCTHTEASAKTSQPSEGISEAEPAGNLSKDRVEFEEPSANGRKHKAAEENDEGSESDSSVEMIDLSNQEVIDIDGSDSESPADTEPAVQPEAPQRSVSTELSCASTQTSQENEPESKFQPSVDSRKDAGTPPDSVEDEEPSLGSFSSHSGAVHGLQVHDGLLYTCSGDNTARVYNLMTRECEGIFYGHTNKINCLLVSSGRNTQARLYTGSSDETIRCYNITSKKCLQKISLPDRVLCLHTAWSILYAGLANGSVISYDLKSLKKLDVFECHGPRGVSCLGTAQEGARRLLLVGSYDNTISVRDAKNGLLLRSLEGHTKTVLCMKVVNDLVFSGSSDTSVHSHNIHTGELVRIYKGHSHAVTSIVILGKVMVTACLDKLIRVYELQSHDRLQVYGGHSDMVMCMAVHKSVIYTGCYDGTVQAVKLNLLKNYRCWWQGCSLIFGVPEHLFHHLTQDHSNPNLQTAKCRWRDCNSFFATQQAVRQDLPEHMQSHVENDSKQQP